MTSIKEIMDNSFHYRIIKGRIAETLIKELFKQAGYNVFEYGMERVMPNILDKIKGKTGETENHIRKMPDFVVQNSVSGELFYVEVKYRHDGRFSLENPETFPYKNTWFIIVSKTDIQCISYPELISTGELKADSGKPLEKSVFNLNSQLVQQYRSYCVDFYSGVK